MQHLTLRRLILGAIVGVLFLIGILHNDAIYRQLAKSQSELTALQRQLADTERQQCRQAYTWKSSNSYPHTVESSGGNRTYTVHTPSSYTPEYRYPVIIAFDGLSGSSRRAEQLSGLNSLPALVVYPEALIGQHGKTAWQGAPYSPKGVNDVQFIDDLLSKMSDEYCVDSERIYTVGMSNGAGFAFIAACELEGQIAGAAGISGAYYSSCSGKSPSPPRVILIHSVDDTVIPFSGSKARSLPNIYRLAQSRSREMSCGGMSVDRGNAIERFTWDNCNNNGRVELIVAHEQPHGWLGVADTSLVPDGALVRRTTSAVIWDFFSDRTTN